MTADTRRRIRRHIENLNDLDEKVSYRAEVCLIHYYGVRAFDALIAACDHTNPIVRWRAGWALGHTRDPRAFETLLRLTRDPDGTVRYESAIALGILGDPRAAEPLITLLCTPDPEEFVDCAAYDGLGRLGEPAAPGLTEVLGHAAPAARGAAVCLLGKIRGETAIPDVVPLLEDPEEDVRVNALEALGFINTPSCLPWIATRFDDPSERVRENAAYWRQEVARVVASPRRSIAPH